MYAIMNTIFPLSAGLRAFSTVTVQIAAQTRAGIGPYSDIVAAITKEGRKFNLLQCFTVFKHMIFIAPSSPKQSMLEVINATAVRLIWSTPDPPNGIILEYQIIYYGYEPVSEEKVHTVPCNLWAIA